jgi:molybdopterin synthase catalytic subunit
LVRDVSDAQNVKSLTLEHYPGMTEKSMQKIVETALSRWPVLRVIAVHRVGRLLIGEQIVYVGVSSQHRKAAIEACEYVIDQLKTKAVLWKKEETAEGEHWLLPTDADTKIADDY